MKLPKLAKNLGVASGEAAAAKVIKPAAGGRPGDAIGAVPDSGLAKSVGGAVEVAGPSSGERLAAIAKMPARFSPASGAKGELAKTLTDQAVRLSARLPPGAKLEGEAAAVGLLRAFAQTAGAQLEVFYGVSDRLKGLTPPELAERRELAAAMLGELSSRLLAQIPVEVLFQWVPEAAGQLFVPQTPEAKALLREQVQFERARNDVALMIEHVDAARERGLELDLGAAKIVTQAQQALDTAPAQWLKPLTQVDIVAVDFLRTLERKQELLQMARSGGAPVLGKKPPPPMGKLHPAAVKAASDPLGSLRKLPEGHPERVAVEQQLIKENVDQAIARVAELKAEVTAGGAPDPLDRYQGVMLASAIGDALGSTTEFLSRKDIRLRVGYNTDLVGGGPFGWQPGGWTDDTQMAVRMGRAIVAKQGFDQEAVAAQFLGWLHTNPPDVGGLTRQTVSMLGAGVPPSLSGVLPWALDGYFNAGNGSVMRASPVSLLTAKMSEADLVRIASQSSEITHADPRATWGTAAVAYGVKLLLAGEENVTAKVAAWLQDKCPSLANALEAIPSLELEDVRTSGYVNDTVQAAFWLLEKTDNIVDALVISANHGEDTDTAGATAGILLGAKYGAQALPKSWLDRIQGREELEDIGKKIFEMG